MTSPRSTAATEQLLRRMYAEVAERTAVARSAPDTGAPLSTRAAPSRLARQVLAAAVVVAILVGGLLVLASRDADRPAGRGAPTRVLPGWVPRLTSPDGSGDLTPFALSELHIGAERDRITYSSDAGSITLELDRTRNVLPIGDPVTVRGRPGRRTDSTLSWLGPDDAVVEVSWSGEVDEAMINSFVQGIAYVDDDTWIDVAGTGGFRREPFESLATVRIEADMPFDVELVGDLHEGLWIEWGPNRIPAGNVDRCGISFDHRMSDFDSNVTAYVVLAPGEVGAAVVRPVGADDRRIELTSLLPLADVSIGGVVYEDRAPNTELPPVDCEDAS